MHRSLQAALSTAGLCLLLLYPADTGFAASSQTADTLSQIQTVVVIYDENRSFDSLYGRFPGAEGLDQAPDSAKIQRDRDGSVLPELPPVWGGITAFGVKPAITQAMSAHLPNGPFQVDATDGLNVADGVPTTDLWHRFYQNQAQINGGRNDQFVAWTNVGAMVMANWDGSRMKMWKIAQRYTLADHFFMGGFGGSFFNHQWLICACAPYYPHADKSPAAALIAETGADRAKLLLAANSPKSVLDGPPKYAHDGDLTPDFYAVNTMQPPYQPSEGPVNKGGDPAFADPARPTTLVPQTAATIGDRLSDAGVSWAWYAGAWSEVLTHGFHSPVPDFQTHHQPLNYYKSFAPGTAARQEHLRDGGMAGRALIADIDAGRLPQVAFYKPQGNLNEHSGYTDIMSGDAHLAEVIGHLEHSPQWPHMLVIVTYDENGGLWDHVAPPKADRWGPGSRIPAIIISPFAKKGVVDHTPYDTTSIQRFLNRRFGLKPLPGLVVRDESVRKRSGIALGDLTGALTLTP
ncbi:acid phosphatase [Acetobacter oeni]|uniref:Acid phosphatase n=2 Tax=Acetobacter oeni TaxID=304077 RepID=A0A511XK52_9PROT|nr:acid phosphatase [Acetobacter oeni]MBB3883143.1 phospholipase C [Acetobacter oeni]NHO19217.1 acid phosphatase [Acetobacter oeni]GEN63323.1 acid phosphatase [Acetobacter oeni]